MIPDGLSIAPYAARQRKRRSAQTRARAGGSVECAGEAAGLRLEAPASEPLELLACVDVEAIEALGHGGATARVVREQGNAGAHHRRQHAIELEPTARVGEKRFDFVE